MNYSQNTPDKFSRCSPATLDSHDTGHQEYGMQSVSGWDLDEKTRKGPIDHSEVEGRLFLTCEEDSDMGFIFETARNSPHSSDIENEQFEDGDEKESTLGNNPSRFSNSTFSYNHLIVNKRNMPNVFLKGESIDECADLYDTNLILKQNDSASAGQKKELSRIKINNNQNDDSDGDESSNATEILFERFKEIDYDFNYPGYDSPSAFSCGSEECICQGNDKSSPDTPSPNQNHQPGGGSKKVAPTPEEITRFWTSPSLPEPFQLSEMIIKLLRENECLGNE